MKGEGKKKAGKLFYIMALSLLFTLEVQTCLAAVVTDEQKVGNEQTAGNGQTVGNEQTAGNEQTVGDAQTAGDGEAADAGEVTAAPDTDEEGAADTEADSDARGDTVTDEEMSEEEIRQEASEAAKDKIIQDMELQQMQDAVNELLGEETFSLEDALHRILKGEQLFSKEYFVSVAKSFLWNQLAAERETMIRVVLLVLVASLFSNFTNVFGDGRTGEISFYVVYMLLLAALVHAFAGMGTEIAKSLQDCVSFMKALMPSYFLAVTAAGGSASAMVFYESVLVLIYLVQVIFLKGILPGINVYVLLELVNYLHSEDFLSKMSELLRTVLEWGMKTCVAVIIGMQIVQNMISPAIDSLKRDVVGKAAAAIPGIGNAINGVTEVALGTAVLVRNGLGVIGIVIFLFIGLPPVIRLGTTTLLYKLLAALVQPVSDKRMVGALSTMGDGCMLLLKVLLVTELLVLITIAVLSVSFIGH